MPFIEGDTGRIAWANAVQTVLNALGTTYAALTHSHTKDQVGLGNVDNTTDAAKPVSDAAALAIAATTARTAGTIGFNSSYEADPVMGALTLFKIGSTVYLEGTVRNKAILSTAANTANVIATIPAGFMPATDQVRPGSLNAAGVGYTFVGFRVTSTGTLTWIDAVARTNSAVSALNVSVSRITWEAA